jgi:hypothetical protein
MVWMKARSINYNNLLHDSSRGVTRLLIPNGADADQSVTDGITSFNSNGFSLGNNGSYNQSTRTYVGWQWKVNGGTTVSNTSGSITSSVQVGATQGISVVTYTGTGANATVGHGLGVTPKMIIVKARSLAGSSWVVYHGSFTSNTNYLLLDSTGSVQSLATVWNSTFPTSSVFSIGTAGAMNQNGQTQVAYCFAEISGFSKFGSYTGNGSTDGVFNYLGFRPKYIMIKNSSAVTDWIVYDTSRSPYNVVDTALNPNNATAEGITSAYNIDLVSNGFKCRSSNASLNSNGATFVYAAFAENPFANANAR